MGKSKRSPTLKPAGLLDCTGVRTRRVEYEPAATIFAQGDPATSVLYVEKGAVRLSVVSHAGKEAVVAVLDEGHFFGEGCLAGQSLRMATATAMGPCSILAVEKPEMVRQLHAQRAFADRFLTHMLTKNIRIEADLIDQMFNPSEKRLARTLLLLARYGEPEASHRVLPRVSQEDPGRDGRHHAFACQLLHEQVSEAFKGYRVLVASSGSEAVTTARAAHPSLIFMDLRMPDMSGWQAMRLLKTEPEFSTVPIVALTAHAFAEEQAAALAAGFDEVIAKRAIPTISSSRLNACSRPTGSSGLSVSSPPSVSDPSALWVYRFFPHRAATAFLAIARRRAGDKAAALATPPLDAPSLDRATAAWLRVSGTSAGLGAWPVASWTICHAS